MDFFLDDLPRLWSEGDLCLKVLSGCLGVAGVSNPVRFQDVLQEVGDRLSSGLFAVHVVDGFCYRRCGVAVPGTWELASRPVCGADGRQVGVGLCDRKGGVTDGEVL